MRLTVTEDRARELARLQLVFRVREIPAAIILEGGDARLVNRVADGIHGCLEPRSLTYHAYDRGQAGPARPFGFLHAVPPVGGFTLYERSWYSCAADAGCDAERAAEHCLAFERYLVDNGIFPVKVLLESAVPCDGADPAAGTFLAVGDADPEGFRRLMSGGLTDVTDTACAPWDRAVADRPQALPDTVADIIIGRLHARLEGACPPRPARMETPYPDPRLRAAASPVPSFDVSAGELARLQLRLAASRRSLVIGIEGRDAAGKGSVIRRLAQALDPRGCKVVEIGVPTGEEREHTHLWRFAEHMPDAGRITVFDRTWYGRMTVEPVEGHCTPAEYARSADEINAMERLMTDCGIIIVKLWLEVSPEEQLARFERRAADELKRWKLTEADWRSRELWDEYSEHIDRMFAATGAPHAPWTVIPSDDKQRARALAAAAVADALRKALDTGGDRSFR